jgi:hypothetical protein
MHSENVKGSYSQIIADELNLDLKNVALSGGSNDWIFLSLIEQLRKINNIHSVIVAWTGLSRFTWTYKERFWMMNGPWATSIKRTTPSNMEFSDWAQNVEQDGVWFNTDDVNCLEALKMHHRLFVENYLDDFKGLREKLLSYSVALNAVCESKNIKLVELAAFNDAAIPGTYYFSSKEKWRAGKHHPTAEEHRLIAKEILNKFYQDK